ncbi:hypothetical protein ACFQFG_26025 [Methylobacterium persicinum]
MRPSDDTQPSDPTSLRCELARGCHPLALWRTEPLPNIAAAAIQEVRRALAGGVCLHHKSWPAARRGEAAAAIAVTLDLTRGTEPDPAVVDLALSAVLVAAWRGMRRRAPSSPTFSPGCRPTGAAVVQSDAKGRGPGAAPAAAVTAAASRTARRS